MVYKFFKKKKSKNTFVEPDEIFLDSKNVQNFDRQQFEGRIEHPIPKKTILLLNILFLLAVAVFAGRLIYLQGAKGSTYLERSENNVLNKDVLFADRGIIYDRNMKPLAWNISDATKNVPMRAYLSPGFSHLVGYISYPAQDSSGNYWQSEYIGKDGLEKEYNDEIQGVNGSKIVETNALRQVVSENIIDIPKQGNALVTSIDSRIQTELYTLIQNLAQSNNFSGGAGIIMNIQNGEILTSTSYPEYDSAILSTGTDHATISKYFTDPRKFFLNRVVSGLYTPGSIVKPYLALGALNEGIIDPSKQILSTGSISIPNPYNPLQKTVFKDWRANGWTDMEQAIAVSSDVYFYTIGGGYGGQQGLGISNIEKYGQMFGFGSTTGVDLPGEQKGTIPSPEWKAKNFKGDPWRIGDTYHTAIGQYGFQVTPIEMVRAVAAIANYGKLLTPHFLLGDTAKENDFTQLNFSKSYFDTVQAGMRMAVTNGTATTLNVPYVQVALKTGTAQVGYQNSKLNSWVMGFLPYQNPKYAFVITMEAGPTSLGEGGATSVMRQLLDWMNINTPEYLK